MSLAATFEHAADDAGAQESARWESARNDVQAMEQRLVQGAQDLRILTEHSDRLSKLEEEQRNRLQQVQDSVRALNAAELDRLQEDWAGQTVDARARAQRKAERLDAIIAQHCPDASGSDASLLSAMAKALLDARASPRGSSQEGWVSADSFSAWQVDFVTDAGLGESNPDGTRELRLVDGLDEGAMAPQ